MAEKRLQRADADSFLDAANGKGVAKSVWGYRLRDPCFAGDRFHYPLNRPDRQARAILKSQHGLRDGSNSFTHGDNPALALAAVWTPFAEDNDTTLLPLDVLAGKAGKLGDPKPGVKKRPDDELLFEGLASVYKKVDLPRVQRLTFVLIHEHLYG